MVYGLAEPLDAAELADCCSSSDSDEDGTAAAGGSRSPHVLHLQVVLRDASGGVSSSEARPLLLPPPADPMAAAAAAAVPAWQSRHHPRPLPLPSNPVERLILSLNGPSFVSAMFWAAWGLQFGVLTGSR
jgi:hypothetical protein